MQSVFRSNKGSACVDTHMYMYVMRILRITLTCIDMRLSIVSVND